jgi:predicted Zn-dependent protease
VLAVAAALGWTTPIRYRSGLHDPVHPTAAAAWAARLCIVAGDPGKALRSIPGLIDAMPHWPGGWKLATDAYAAMGKDAEAAQCAARIRL